jgi:hypothetical protein
LFKMDPTLPTDIELQKSEPKTPKTGALSKFSTQRHFDTVRSGTVAEQTPKHNKNFA